ncbi:MAG: hypothetical protein ACOZQL_36820 [Myxococcota bacterium]
MARRAARGTLRSLFSFDPVTPLRALRVPVVSLITPLNDVDGARRRQNAELERFLARL